MSLMEPVIVETAVTLISPVVLLSIVLRSVAAIEVSEMVML